MSHSVTRTKVYNRVTDVLIKLDRDVKVIGSYLSTMLHVRSFRNTLIYTGHSVPVREMGTRYSENSLSFVLMMTS